MENHSAALLQARHLSFSYPGQVLFSDWSGDIVSGINLVLGGDGRGKTSLLQLLAGDLQAQSGQLQIQGICLHEQPVLYRRQVFWVDPRTDVFDQISVEDYFVSVRGNYPQFDEAMLESAIEGLALTPHLHKNFYMLSTGSKRKVWLAAAFAAGASINLLDDPFAALDKTSIDFIVNTLKQLAQDSSRAWVLAMYVTPQGLPLSGLIELGD
ncbi:ABC transporter ATP-binding protein [Undibacterium umbellatum]|uniref:ATP-binding cassette domain-containing protein n=1 Tax=Undibacterium umbellatum TaxID=2762300 RepID=A0ABR6Z9W3_9BURK|nr:ATP-binding cassette domain-containing protein [Undibacterium umbellatum]MBC3908414.1 ATP-binding cassette domain-containing protein [Undibacterium umbellatum]